MPLHDWSREFDGLFHDFHQAWITAIRDVLNERLLPDDFYALAEQSAGGPVPDVPTLERKNPASPRIDGDTEPGVLLLDAAPPQVAYTLEGEREIYAHKASRLAIHQTHRSGDDVVGYVQIVSAGNKHNLREMEAFLKKVREALESGLHLLIIDVHPPTSRDPRGLHDAIWRDWYGEVETPGTTDEKPYTLVSYVADYIPRAYFEPVGLGETLPPMPLFLTTELYVNVPLEETYIEAWRGVPRHYKRILEGNNT